MKAVQIELDGSSSRFSLQASQGAVRMRHGLDMTSRVGPRFVLEVFS